MGGGGRLEEGKCDSVHVPVCQSWSPLCADAQSVSNTNTYRVGRKGKGTFMAELVL